VPTKKIFQRSNIALAQLAQHPATGLVHQILVIGQQQYGQAQGIGKIMRDIGILASVTDEI
jgi:hypothetical protein